MVDPLVQSPNGDRLRIVPGDSDWVIRFVSPRQFAAAPDLLQRTRRGHDELGAHGFDVPPRTYLEVDDGGRTMLVLVPRIDGTALADAIAGSSLARRAAERVVANLLRYYATKFVDRMPYLGDLHLGQFMWGTHHQCDEPRAWLVDLDAGTGALPIDPDARQIALLHWWIGESVNGAIEVERRSGTPAVAYRALLDELADGEVFSHPSAAGRVDRMREALATGQPFDANEEWVQPLLD